MINNKVHGFSEKIIADLIDQVPEETLFIKVSVHDFLWGYEDNLLKIINGLDNSIPIKMPLIVRQTDDGQTHRHTDEWVAYSFLHCSSVAPRITPAIELKLPDRAVRMHRFLLHPKIVFLRMRTKRLLSFLF